MKPSLSLSNSSYELICGLEIHAELKTASKMFCGCKNDPFGASEPNIYTCPVCLGLPGALPMANKKAVEWTLKIGLATNCKINYFSKFDRKHYFYPDLAKGYQISQYDLPFCYDGKVSTSAGTVRLTRIHLEEDTGKLLHTAIGDKRVSLIDFNRSGVPLVEIVTEPDIISGEHAKELGKKLRQLLRFLGVADCDMEQGGMRLEANISLRKKGEKGLPNYKVEIKNINSFRFLEQAINYELERQAAILDSGKVPVQETRGWNAEKNQTTSQRSKEEAEDYRYFPDPDIPPIRLTKEFIEKVRASLPELPEESSEKLIKVYKLTEVQANQLISFAPTQSDPNWLNGTLSLAHEKKLDVTTLANDIINKKINITPTMSSEATISAFEAFHATETIDASELTDVIKDVLKTNAAAVEKYHKGERQVFGFLMGQVLRNFKQKVDPKTVREALQAALEA